jgi:oligopeptide/dipeptide ABC transporter ATP-binding protein
LPLLSVQGLTVHYSTVRGIVHAVDGVTFDLEEGENLGLVGESGCGKSTIAKSLLRILPPNASIAGGHIIIRGTDIIPLKGNEVNKIRWKEISIISQSAMNALNPVYNIEYQIVEIFRLRWALKRNEAIEKAVELFECVGLDRARLKEYPHQFSGGMRQRVVIAMALALNPSVIIADEPTTALDVIIQDQVLKNIYDLQKKFNKSIVLITHDISIVAETCDKIAVMYAGKLMEYGDIRSIFRSPYHPYTIGLLNAFPSLLGGEKNLISIPGFPPNLIRPPEGCRFCGRCPFSIPRCKEEEPGMIRIDTSHVAACHRVERAEEFRTQAQRREIWEKGSIDRN